MMDRTLLLWVIAALLVASIGCSDVTTQEDHRQALLNTLEERGHAMAQGDMEKIFSFWTDDVVIYPVSEPEVKGIAAVRQYVRRNRQELGLRPRLSPLEVVASKAGDIGYIVGRYEWIDREGQATLPGRYVSMWRKNEQGAWKCFLEIHSPLPVQDADAAEAQ
jgi:ketosteroid isomerase-like protein